MFIESNKPVKYKGCRYLEAISFVSSLLAFSPIPIFCVSFFIKGNPVWIEFILGRPIIIVCILLAILSMIFSIYSLWNQRFQLLPVVSIIISSISLAVLPFAWLFIWLIENIASHA